METVALRPSTKLRTYTLYIHVSGVSEGIVNILGGGSMKYSE
jgi:hypothetical protein